MLVVPVISRIDSIGGGQAGGRDGWEAECKHLDSNNSAVTAVFDMNPRGGLRLLLAAVWYPMQSY